MVTRPRMDASGPSSKVSVSVHKRSAFGFLVLALLFVGFPLTNAFQQNEEQAFINLFPTLIRSTYSTPGEFTAACALAPGQTRTLSYASLAQTTLTRSMGTDEAQRQCGRTSLCIVPAGVTLTVNSNFVTAAILVNGGTLTWTDATQQAPLQWVCAGSIVATNRGRININMGSASKRAVIYIQNNGVADPALGYRTFGGRDGASVTVQGRPMTRTWSLLAASPAVGSSSITLLHDPAAMGWAVGDRIQIAPTIPGSRGSAETYYISGFAPNNVVRLASDPALRTPGSIGQVFMADYLFLSGPDFTAQMAAEVINLNRNVLITGDDFENVNCVPPNNAPPGSCECSGERRRCTMGLHTVQSGSGVMQFRNIRVEKCGQRGVLGKYCTHFHLIGICDDCVMEGNAIENGMQRGTVIHGTSASQVKFNVYSGVRGANVYVEDGNEVYNHITYNVAICPWPLTTPNAQPHELHGCTIPGTDNAQADTALNQAGFWGTGFQNYLIGNRAANSYNGMLYQAQGFENGRGAVQNNLCSNNQLMGRLEGNTFHGCGRFGTYILVSVFPKKTDRTINNNGVVLDRRTCNAFDDRGIDRGANQALYRQVDYHNTFVGQYGAGDISYIEHFAAYNNNNMYWKETKNPADGCAPHISKSVYTKGSLLLPGGHGTFIMDKVTLIGSVDIESSHHCGAGVTGVLCMPTYVFSESKWVDPDMGREWIHWGENNGAMFTLSPPECANPTGNIFPASYCSVAHPFWTYLLALDGGATCRTAADVGAQIGIPTLRNNWARGILCRRGLRRLEVFTIGMSRGQNPPPLRLELLQNGRVISTQNVPYYQVGSDGDRTRKQGYAMTVVPGLTHSYRLSLNGAPIPSTWVIEFSDTIFANRYGTPDQIDLTVVGRTCPSPVTSSHDRKFIWGDSNNNYLTVPGRGACSNFPDEPRTPCASAPTALSYLSESCPACAGVTCGPNGYCDCGTRKCFCKSGYSGANCEVDICANAGCDRERGACVMRYLGGNLPVTVGQCVCKQGEFGSRCNANPCNGVDCSGNGKCSAISATEAVCTCNNGWDGPTCNNRCSPQSSCRPPCINGMSYYPNSDFNGANAGIQATPTKEACGTLCLKTPACAGWAWNGNTCYMKQTGRIVPQQGVWGGAKCTSVSITQGGSSVFPPPPAIPPPSIPPPAIPPPVIPPPVIPPPVIPPPVIRPPTVIAPPTVTPPATRCVNGIVYHPDSDFAGPDTFVQNTPTKEACAALCLTAPRCIGWAWNGNTCYLKETGRLISQPGIWAGVKCGNPPPRPPPPPPTPPPSNAGASSACVFDEDIDYFGNDIEGIPAASKEICCGICWSMPKCHAWTFAGNMCYTKVAPGPDRRYAPGVWSGTVARARAVAGDSETQASTTSTTPQTIAIVAGCVVGALLIVIVAIVILRRGKTREETV